MRYSEILAVSAVLANGAVAAPQLGIWPFYSSSQSSAATSTSAKTSCSSTVKSSTSSAAASVVASSSVKTSSSSAVVVASTSSSSSSSASSTSKAAVVSTSTSASSTSVAAPSTSSSAASSTVVVSTSTSSSSSAYVSPTIVASDDGYNYQFCAIEPFENGVPGGRAFVGDSFSDPSMTVDLCGDFCSNLNYTMFGVEYADECYCGNSFADGTTLDVNNDCNMACAGDNTEYCGGAGALNVYEVAGGASYNLPTTYTYTATATASATAAGSAASSTASATPVPAAGGFNYVSCAVEPFEQSGLSYRALQDDSTSSSNMTVAACATYCSGYAYFGVEYSSQCYCGNTIAAGTTQDATDATCNMACAGDATEQCGGAGRMNLYENSANGGVQTSLATTYVATATSTSSVATSSAAAASTTSSVVASSTSSASSSATVSSSSSAVSSAAATTVKSSSTVVPTTMATSTKSASTTTSAAAAATGVCAPQGSVDLTTCPTLSVGSLFGNAKYTKYYSGSGYTLNPVNPGSLLNKIFPPKVFTFSGSHSMCSAASQCLQQAGLAATLYHNIDLHWQTDSCQWSCTMQQGINTQPSFFNVAKPTTVSHGCGFSGGLW